ncbi:MAG: hypothetical protein ABSE70_02840 [Candidatus Limnocylindrales bacterium]
MSLYYNPQIVKLLTEERIREAQEARRHSVRRTTARPSRLAGAIGRLFASQATPSTCAC